MTLRGISTATSTSGNADKEAKKMARNDQFRAISIIS